MRIEVIEVREVSHILGNEEVVSPYDVRGEWKVAPCRKYGTRRMRVYSC